MNELAFESMMKLLTPHRAKGYEKLRMGQPYDGGYVLLDDFDGIKLAIAGGLNNDDSWELETLKLGIPVMAFDHSDGYIYQGVDRGYQWFKEPMRGFDSGNSTLDLILSGYADNSVIAKIDIEGDEWKMWANTRPENLKKIRQFVCEFHNFPMFEGAIETVSKLFEQFRVVHVHGNNCDIAFSYKNQVVPRVIELTFANKDFYDLEVSGEVFPSELDAPNNERAEDFILNTFTIDE